MSKLIFFVGLSRSGTHAVMNWIFDQFCDPKLHFVKMRPDRPLDSSVNTEMRLVIVGFENISIDAIYNRKMGKTEEVWKTFYNCTHVLLLRDPFNRLASRLKSCYNIRKDYKSKLKKLKKLAKPDDLYKSYAREFLGETNYLSNKICVRYDKWFSNLNYRRDLFKMVGGDCFSDSTLNTVTPYGGASSFDKLSKDGNAQTMNVFNRWKFLKKVPKQQLAPLLDPELLFLTRKIFGRLDAEYLLGYGENY